MPDNPLTPSQRTRYEVLKQKAKSNLLEGFLALQEIHDDQLYVEEYGTWEAFCQKELGHTRQHVTRLLKAQYIADEMEPIGSLENESQARPLGRLSDPLEQKVALQLAYSAAAKVIPSGKPTAALIEEAVATVEEIKATRGKVDLGDGKMSNAEGSLIIRHNERVQGRIEETNRKREQKNGTIVSVIKRAQCRIVAARDKQVVFEFDDPEVAKNLMRLYYEKAGHGLLMDLLKKHE